MVQRQSVHHRPVVCSAHADVAGVPRAEVVVGDGGGLRRFLQRLSIGDPQWRCVRDEASDLGFQSSKRKHTRAKRCARARGAGGGRSDHLVQAHAVEERPVAGEMGAGVRGLSIRAMDAWRVQRLLEATGHLRRGLLRSILGRAAVAYVELVRRLCAYRHRQLCGAEEKETQPRAPDHGAVDAW